MINNDHSNNRNDNTLKDAKIEQFITTTIPTVDPYMIKVSINLNRERP